MSDTIKEYLLENFSSALSADMIILSLLTAFVISLYIIYVYRKTFSGVVFNRNILLTIVLLTIVTSMIIRTINSNLSLSLGMVGALSIVRFRTAIKDPLDIAFLFWAITAGIMSGAGLYLMALLGSLLLGVLFYLAYTYNVKTRSQYLLVITYNKSSETAVNEELSKIKDKKLKNKTINAKDVTEATYEVILNDDGAVYDIKNIHGVSNVSLVSYRNEI